MWARVYRYYACVTCLMVRRLPSAVSGAWSPTEKPGACRSMFYKPRTEDVIMLILSYRYTPHPARGWPLLSGHSHGNILCPPLCPMCPYHLVCVTPPPVMLCGRVIQIFSGSSKYFPRVKPLISRLPLIYLARNWYCWFTNWCGISQTFSFDSISSNLSSI